MFKRGIKLFLILVIITLFYTGYSILNLGNDRATVYEFTESKEPEEAYEEPRKEEKVYDEAKDYEKTYDKVENGLIEGKKIISLVGLRSSESNDVIFEILEGVAKDNPEIMYYAGARYGNGILMPRYEKEVKEIKLHQKMIGEKREEILLEIITPNMTDYEKVKAVHDYIINNTKYDRNYLEDKEISPESHTVYGTLIEGVAVCDGYAKSMKYLLEPLEIEAIIVSGKSRDMNHAWNIVKIEDNYYHVDTTWDDPVTESGQDIIAYDYFSLNDEDISRTHRWDKEKYPSCVATKYNYYYYNNLLINNYDEFYSLLKESILSEKDNISFRILNYDKEVYNVSNAMNQIVANITLGYKGIGFNYSINEELGIINIKFQYEK